MPNDNFVCARCGNCCRIEGLVRLADGEAEAIAAFLGMSTDEFVDSKTELALDRRGLVLKDKEDLKTCVFLGDDGCEINPVKPRQCRDFPASWNNDGWEEICAAAKQKHGAGKTGI